MNTHQTRNLLRSHNLRATSPRIAVLRALAKAQSPLSHSEVVTHLRHHNWDPATIYRNLVKFREVGLISVVSQAKGMDRYAFNTTHEDHHNHAHFLCNACGRITCLPAELTLSTATQGPWATSIQNATLQLHGACPTCLAQKQAP